MRCYLDTTVLLHAASRPAQEPSPVRDACQRLVAAIGDGTVEAAISTEVLQELLHTAAWRQARAQGLALVDLARTLFPHPLVVSAEAVGRAAALLRGEPRLGTRVALHAAVMAEGGLGEVISTDGEFGLVSGIRRLSPLDAVALLRL